MSEAEKENEEETSESVAKKEHPHYSPITMWHELDNIFEAVKREFENHFWHPFRPFVVPQALEHKTKLPVIDLKEREKEYILTAELPGITKEDIDITLTSDQIEIVAARAEEEGEEHECFVCQERSSQRYERIFRFPEEIDAAHAEAMMEHGVLNVVLPKKEPKPSTERRKLTIQ